VQLYKQFYFHATLHSMLSKHQRSCVPKAYHVIPSWGMKGKVHPITCFDGTEGG
jgi:hypothetical protein